MRKRILAVLMIVTLMMSLLTGCKTEKENNQKEDTDQKETIEIGITFDTFILERWTRDRDIFVATAQKAGAEVDVQNANGNVKKQIQQMNHFIENQVDVIVVVAVDCFSLSEVVTKARGQGIKVISYDRMIQGAKTDLYITVDNEAVGKEMGRQIKAELPEGGNVVMICGPEADTNSLDVANGFQSELKESNWKIVSQTHVKSWTPEYGFQAVNEAFQNLHEIDAVMCGNDGLASYAIQALSEQQLAGQVVVVGQDADLEACQRIVEGTQSMTVYKPIEELARMGAEYAVKLASDANIGKSELEKAEMKKTEGGENVPYYGLTPLAVTKENMDQIIIESGFHLRDEVYLNIK